MGHAGKIHMPFSCIVFLRIIFVCIARVFSWCHVHPEQIVAGAATG